MKNRLSSTSLPQIKDQSRPIEGQDEKVQDIATYQNRFPDRCHALDQPQFVSVENEICKVKMPTGIGPIIASSPDLPMWGKSQFRDESLGDDCQPCTRVELSLHGLAAPSGQQIRDGYGRNRGWRIVLPFIARHRLSLELRRRKVVKGRLFFDSGDQERDIPEFDKHSPSQILSRFVVANYAPAVDRHELPRIMAQKSSTLALERTLFSRQLIRFSSKPGSFGRLSTPNLKCRRFHDFLRMQLKRIFCKPNDKVT